MHPLFSPSLLAALVTLSFVPSLHAKDRVVTLEQCPEAVQKVIRHYGNSAKVEEIGLDEKKKSGGPAVYEAKLALPDGRRLEVHISATGSVLRFEEKKQDDVKKPK
jgi:uncharacterized membrane protein YkoI